MDEEEFIPWERTKKRIQEGRTHLSERDWAEIRFTILTMDPFQRGKMAMDRGNRYLNKEYLETIKQLQIAKTTRYNNKEYIQEIMHAQKEKARKRAEKTARFVLRRPSPEIEESFDRS